jgi:hypothetical protein
MFGGTSATAWVGVQLGASTFTREYRQKQSFRFVIQFCGLVARQVLIWVLPMDPIFADGAAKLRSRAAPSARIEPHILFLTDHQGLGGNLLISKVAAQNLLPGSVNYSIVTGTELRAKSLRSTESVSFRLNRLAAGRLFRWALPLNHILFEPEPSLRL